MSRTRREFLQSALATGTLVGLGEASSPGPPSSRSRGMPLRVLGRTGKRVSMLGMGCAYAGGGVSEAQTRATIEAAIDGGVTYFDAAPEYTQAEERLGPVVKPVRDKVFLVSKSYAFDAKGAEKDLTTALRQLKTDYVDLFLQHGVGLRPIAETRNALGKGGSLAYLRKAKAKGLIRHIGMSVHAPHAAALELLREADDWDVVMPFINYVAWAREEMLAESDVEVVTVSDYERVFEHARKRKLGIVGMKIFGGHPGKLTDDYDRAFRYALSVPGVACVLVGARSADEVRRAVAAAKAFRPMTEDEVFEARQRGDRMVRRRTSHATDLERHIRADLGSGWVA